MNEARIGEAHRSTGDGCDCLVAAVAALTRYRVQLGYLEGGLYFWARRRPTVPATDWTHDLDAHLMDDPETLITISL